MAGISKLERPFKIYDENAKLDLPWRSYKTEKRAVEQALILLYWLELGNSCTVYDTRSSRAIIQFTRKISGIHVLK